MVEMKAVRQFKTEMRDKCDCEDSARDPPQLGQAGQYHSDSHVRN